MGKSTRTQLKEILLIAIDTPGGNLNFVRNIKAQATALNRAIT